MKRPSATLRQEALDALLAQDARKAFSTFRWALEYPGAQELEQPAQWKDAWELLARIAVVFAGEEFANIVRRATHTRDDVQALYALSYHLIEQSWPARVPSRSPSVGVSRSPSTGANILATPDRVSALPDVVRIWRRFSGNNSGDCMLVGR